MLTLSAERMWRYPRKELARSVEGGWRYPRRGDGAIPGGRRRRYRERTALFPRKLALSPGACRVQATPALTHSTGLPTYRRQSEQTSVAGKCGECDGDSIPMLGLPCSDWASPSSETA